MGILSEAFTTVVEVQRTMDGKIWDYATQKWLSPTPASLTAADTAVTATLGAMIDLLPFPISASVLGIITLNVTRAQMDTAIGKIQAAVKAYVAATRVNM
jgi:hypothetical protein